MREHQNGKNETESNSNIGNDGIRNALADDNSQNSDSVVLGLIQKVGSFSEVLQLL